VFAGVYSIRGAIRCGCFGLVCLGLAGCEQPEGIRRYTVEKAAPSDRMWAAIVPQSDQVWFFKATGPNSDVAERADQLAEFLRSISFTDGRPVWQIPENWSERPAAGLRFATIEIPTDGPPLELSVTTLPLPDEENQQAYILSNINRWRQQLQLSPISVDRLTKETEEVRLAGENGLIATVVSMGGRLSGGGMGGRGSGGLDPVAGSGGLSRTPEAGSEADPQLHFEAPDGWQEGEKVVSRGGLTIRRAAVYNIEDGEQQAEVTITSLPETAGDRLQNINRWRRQVQLDPIEADELTSATSKIEIDHVGGDYVELIGPRQAVLGVIADHAGAVWFIKLQGNHDLALQEREQFRAFVASIKFHH
jgi:hypothetical protein